LGRVGVSVGAPRVSASAPVSDDMWHNGGGMVFTEAFFDWPIFPLVSLRPWGLGLMELETRGSLTALITGQ